MMLIGACDFSMSDTAHAQKEVKHAWEAVLRKNGEFPTLMQHREVLVGTRVGT